MDNQNLFILQELFQETLEHKQEIENKLRQNESRLEEIAFFFKSCVEKEESDLLFFSPRSSLDLYKDQKAYYVHEKENIEKDNQYQNKQLEKVNRYLECLEDLLNHLNESDSKKDKIDIFKNNEKSHLIVLDIQEKERKRISRELHDTSLQNLSYLVHAMELISMYIDKDIEEAKSRLYSCTGYIKEVINDIRDIIFNLRPMSFVDIGFRESIENYIINLRQQYSDIEISCEFSGIPFDIDNKRSKEDYNLIFVTIYRITQEAMMNALKHSGADHVVLKIENFDDHCSIEISDNGKGFSTKKIEKNNDNHFGISIMKERISLLNGSMSIESERGKGTSVKVILYRYDQEE